MILGQPVVAYGNQKQIWLGNLPHPVFRMSRHPAFISIRELLLDSTDCVFPLWLVSAVGTDRVTPQRVVAERRIRSFNGRIDIIARRANTRVHTPELGGSQRGLERLDILAHYTTNDSSPMKNFWSVMVLTNPRFAYPHPEQASVVGTMTRER